MSPAGSSTYSLAGVQHATTKPQELLVLRVIDVLADDDRVLAGYLIGGFAVGQGDAFSDVDLQFIIEDDAVEDLSASWTSLLELIASPAHVQPFPGVIGGSVITPAWLHYDVVFNPRSSADVTKVEGMVFDKAALLPAGPVPRPNRGSRPRRVCCPRRI